MKYIKKFENQADLEAYKNSSDFTSPYIGLVLDNRDVKYQPYIPPVLAGDIAYWDGSKVKTVSQEKWNTSLGTPVGVVVVPTGFAPDGKARMLSLNWASSSSTSATSVSYSRWSKIKVETSLTNHNCVPTTDNAGSTTTGSNSSGYLPSDKFAGATSYVDSTVKYDMTYSMIPSPYLGNKPNPAYYAEISGYNNALSDFAGKSNTDILVALGSDYVAANAARNYKVVGAEEIEWYLPAIGELGYMMVRFNKIQDALTKVNAPQLVDNYDYWSSSEYSSNNAYYMNTSNGPVSNSSKLSARLVRPFAIID